MNKAPVKMLAGFSSIAGLVLLLVVTFNVAQRPQPYISQAVQETDVSLFSDYSVLEPENTVVIDFSKVNCCRTLSAEYMEDGVVFDNEDTLGWNTQQANGFANHITTEVSESGSAAGISGTRITFTDLVKKVGFMVQSETPYNSETVRPAKSLTLKVYDQNNNLLFYEVTDTCLQEASSCRPKFVAAGSESKNIKTIEVTINEPSNWSIDDLMFEI